MTVLALRCLRHVGDGRRRWRGRPVHPPRRGRRLAGATIGGAVNRGDLELFIVVGVAAFLGAGYRVPLAAVMFVAETTGRASFVVPALLAAVAAELVMGRSSVTEYQVASGTVRTEPTSDPRLGEPAAFHDLFEADA